MADVTNDDASRPEMRAGGHVLRDGRWVVEDGPLDYPVEVGGGWYELSDGERVQGRVKAEQAQAELDGVEYEPESDDEPDATMEAPEPDLELELDEQED